MDNKWSGLQVFISLILAYAVSTYVRFAAWFLNLLVGSNWSDFSDWISIAVLGSGSILAFLLLLLHWWFTQGYKDIVVSRRFDYIILIVIPIIYAITSDLFLPLHYDIGDKPLLDVQCQSILLQNYTIACGLNLIAFGWYFFIDWWFDLHDEKTRIENRRMRYAVIAFFVFVILSKVFIPDGADWLKIIAFVHLLLGVLVSYAFVKGALNSPRHRNSSS